jgi:hypothetical protein
MLRTTIWISLMFFLMIGTGPVYHPRSFTAHAQDDWKAEFGDICSKTDDAMALTITEIKSLIERCDKLKPRIEKLDESTAKVYLKRLQMCKDLFVFVLESKPK